VNTPLQHTRELVTSTRVPSLCHLEDTGSCVADTVHVVHARVLLTTGSIRRNVPRGTRRVSSTPLYVFLKSSTRSSTKLVRHVKRFARSPRVWTSSPGPTMSSTGRAASATRITPRWAQGVRLFSTARTAYARRATHSPRSSKKEGVHIAETLF
jgi:hypothetical protein